MNKNHYAVIMAGGVGSRFWPLSRRQHPKQFLDILGKDNTLFQTTFKRFAKICPVENIVVVTNEQYRDLIKEQCPQITDQQILGEPMARNTAPCIAYAAHKIHNINPDASIVVAPSDHLIMDEEEFAINVKKCMDHVEKYDHLVTLGIKPTRPDTGYGYIQMVEDHKEGQFVKVKTFTEKPNEELAQHFFESGEFLWNAGIFIWNVKAILDAFRKHLPELNESFNKGKKYLNTENERKFITDTYSTLPMISIDYGIMEKAQNVYVLPADFRWSDVGTWNSLFDFLEKDENNNAIKGKQVFSRNTTDCIVNVSEKKLVALNNVKNLIIVESDNILLIADKGKEQDIRMVVNEIRARFGEKYI